MDFLEFDAWQWCLLIGLFLATVFFTEHTLAGMKRDAVREILWHYRDTGWCLRCLERERKRLQIMSYAAVEAERIRLKSEEKI